MTPRSTPPMPSEDNLNKEPLIKMVDADKLNMEDPLMKFAFETYGDYASLFARTAKKLANHAGRNELKTKDFHLVSEIFEELKERLEHEQYRLSVLARNARIEAYSSFFA
jgi:uncharacterized protein YwgA